MKMKTAAERRRGAADGLPATRLVLLLPRLVLLLEHPVPATLAWGLGVVVVEA
jgi:hypothetical protein